MNHLHDFPELCVCLGCQTRRKQLCDLQNAPLNSLTFEQQLGAAHGLGVSLTPEQQREASRGLGAWIPDSDGNGPFFGVARPKPLDPRTKAMATDPTAFKDALRSEIDSARESFVRHMMRVHLGDCPPGCDHPIHRPVVVTWRQRLASYPRRLSERVGNLLIELGRRLGGYAGED